MATDTERETRRRYIRVLRRAMDEAGLSEQRLADHLGFSKGVVRKWLSDEDRSQMRLHDVARAPATVARHVIEALAADHGLAVEGATAPADLDHRAHFTRLMTALNQAYQHYHHVLSTHEGHVTNDELISLEAQVREARDALGQLAAWVRDEKRRRGMV